MNAHGGAAMAHSVARNSPEGLFLRYCRGRHDGFLVRQSMTVAGSLSIALLGAPYLGLIAFVLALSGEAIEWVALRRILRRSHAGKLPNSARKLATATALLQALTIAACVILCWRLIPAQQARFFAAVFLMSAHINAGLVRRHFPEGAQVRMAVYALTGTAMISLDVMAQLRGGNVGDWFFVIAVGILGYTATLFIGAIAKGQGERLRFEAALLTKQEALEQSRQALADEGRKSERLALVARHANDSVIFTAPNGRIEWVNEAFTRCTGYSFSEAVGQSPGDLLNAPDTSPEALDILHRAQRDGHSCRIEIQNRTKSGRLVWMEVSMTPILNADGTPDVFIAVERDISLAKAHHAELAQARAAAELGAQTKSTFLATMSHEIRTPLNGVIGVAELIADTPLNATQRKYVETIMDSGRALLAVINDVLDLAKLQSKQTDMPTEPFSVADCISRSIDLLQPTADKKGILLVVDIPPKMPDHLGQPGRLRQILLNLIGNAVKFTIGGHVTVTVLIEPDGPNDTIRIAIADTGIGIPADRITQVFESFNQADTSISRRFGGTGLGLTISRLLARQMGGDIDVTSVLNQGSVFSLTLNLPRCQTAKPAGITGKSAAPVTGLRLLVAEDNRTNMMITRKFLERSVASIAEACDGQAAVDMYRADPPDLVLMDLSMPGKDGNQATREIRLIEAAAGLPRCPIIALTAHSMTDQESGCLQAGMDGVLTKPLVRAELFALLERVAADRGFDLPPGNTLDMGSNGEPTWSISPRASGITNGRLIRSSGR